MKQLLGILFMFLFWCNIGNAGNYGKGELKLSQAVADYFIKYLRGGISKSPLTFVVTNDGTWGTYWFCPSGANNCSGDSPSTFIKICERETDQDCSIFARFRTVKWKNGINPGKGKESKFNSRWSDEEIKAKLTELGFLGETNTTTKIIEKKKKENKVKTTDDNNDITQQLKDLNELYKSGALTKEEFEKAKKKLLN